MARAGDDIPALELTKGFDTNYHYLVPEFQRGQQFRWASTKPLDELAEARALGIATRLVLLGPGVYDVQRMPGRPPAASPL